MATKTELSYNYAEQNLEHFLEIYIPGNTIFLPNREIWPCHFLEINCPAKISTNNGTRTTQKHFFHRHVRWPELREGGDSIYKKGRDARREFWNWPLRETNLGVARAFFDP